MGGGHTSRGKVAVEAARPARAPAATSTAGGMSRPCFCSPPPTRPLAPGEAQHIITLSRPCTSFFGATA